MQLTNKEEKYRAAINLHVSCRECTRTNTSCICTNTYVTYR